MRPDHILEQTQWDTFWVPPDTTIIDRPSLLCTAHPRDSPTLNSANRIRCPDASLGGLLAAVVGAHAGRRSRVPVNPQNRRPALHAALRAAGYAQDHEHDGYTIAADAPRRPSRPGLVVRRIDSMARLCDAISVSNRAFVRDEQPGQDELMAQLATCAAPTGRVHRFVAYAADGEPLASAGMTLFPGLGFAFFWGGGVVPSCRGRGAYTALVTARLRQASQRGMASAGLYARLETAAPIVSAQGFRRHGRMTFWERPATVPG